MQNIGFNPNRNTKPAFGCDSETCKPCDHSKRLLKMIGYEAPLASKMVNDATASDDPIEHARKAKSLDDFLSANKGAIFDWKKAQNLDVSI